MKGLILAGGQGTRLRPLTFTRAKQLIPIANKPNLFYVIEDLVAAGLRELGVIISPETGDEVQAALGNVRPWDVQITYILQSKPLGLAHAVRTAQPFLGDDPFVMYLGDNLLSGGIRFLVDAYQAGRPDAVVLVTPVDNPQQFGVVNLDATGHITHLVEKPAAPTSNLALVGVYLFSPAIHGVIEHLQPSRRGEYEITDAIQGLVDLGRPVVAHQVRGWWKDTGRAEDLLDANRLVLSQIQRHLLGELQDAQVIGEVVIEPGAQLVRTTVRGPAHIAQGAYLEDSYIGPYTSVGAGCQVLRSEVEYSILLRGAVVQDLPYRLDSSVLGQDVRVEGGKQGVRRHTLQLVLGDRSQVCL